MTENPKLYEINTRVWIKKFATAAALNNEVRTTLEDIPPDVWDDFLDRGIDIVWMMGVWKTCPDTVKKYCFEEFLIRNYEKALRDWKDGDVIGSPYAIDEYVLNPQLGHPESLWKLKMQLNNRGLKLFLDFVPNHFNAGSRLIKTHPEIFLEVDEDFYQRDPYTYFKSESTGRYFAHGRDPFFPAWQDTVQVNYYSPEAIEFMTNQLLEIARYCDGVRCDMAMLPLRNVFSNTWSGVLNKMNIRRPEGDFWKYAIEKVKRSYPGFIFMAEAYWDLEWELQQLGFDYTYDKRLTDRLLGSNVESIKDHLRAEMPYQQKSVRFIENHDEERAMAAFGKNKSQAAAVITSTLSGMRFYHDGQFEGRRVKLPVQLGRDSDEPNVQCMMDFYKKLLTITKDEPFRSGQWQLMDILPAWSDNKTCENMLAWLWTLGKERRLVVVNYSDIESQCRIKLDLSGYDDSFSLTDLMTGQQYLRATEEAYHMGLYIDLKAWHSHIFAY